MVAERAYTDLQAGANLADATSTASLAYESELAAVHQNRFNNEEVVARVWEHSYNEAIAEGNSIRLQACEHVDQMQVLHDKKVNKAEKAARYAAEAKALADEQH